MNRHFSDARYYLGRAASHLTIGLREEFSPLTRRIRARFGEESAPVEPETRTERLRFAATRSKRRVAAGATRVKRHAWDRVTDEHTV